MHNGDWVGRGRSVKSMALFLNLYLGHLLGDFLLQPGRLVLAKRDGIAGLLTHTLIVGGATVAVLFATIRSDWPAVVLVTALHLVIERLTILTYVKTPTRGLFTLLFDQTLHMLCIAVVVWVLGGWELDASAVTFGLLVPASRLATIDGLLTVMLLGSILVFETANALRRSTDSKGRVLRLDAARVGGMLERGVGFSAAIVWHPAAAILAFLPRLAYAATRPRGQRGEQVLNAATGLVLCAVVYSAVAAITYLTRGAYPTGAPLSVLLGPWS
jgi:hypothetical protein